MHEGMQGSIDHVTTFPQNFADKQAAAKEGSSEGHARDVPGASPSEKMMATINSDGAHEIKKEISEIEHHEQHELKALKARLHSLDEVGVSGTQRVRRRRRRRRRQRE